MRHYFYKILMLHYHFRLPFNALVASFLTSKLMLFPTTRTPYSNSSLNGISWYKDVAVNTELLQWGVAAGNVGHGTMLQGSARWSMVGKSKGKPKKVLSLLLSLALPQPSPSSRISCSAPTIPQHLSSQCLTISD